MWLFILSISRRSVPCGSFLEKLHCSSHAAVQRQTGKVWILFQGTSEKDEPTSLVLLPQVRCSQGVHTLQSVSHGKVQLGLLFHCVCPHRNEKWGHCQSQIWIWGFPKFWTVLHTQHGSDNWVSMKLNHSHPAGRRPSWQQPNFFKTKFPNTHNIVLVALWLSWFLCTIQV